MSKNIKYIEVKNAFFIGVLSAVAYLACYFAKNILSVITPQMVDKSGITVEFIGTISTANMFCYAGGQLINGIIGDKVKAKYLVSVGLFFAGICNWFVPFGDAIVMIAAYSLSGFFLSMLYSPLVKLIAENMHPVYAMRCCLGLTFASLFGVPAAGVIALFFKWENVFRLCGGILILLGILCFSILSLFEKRGIVKYRVMENKEKKIRSIKVLLEHSIVKFTLVSVLTGIVRASVVFWVPTYLSQYLGFSAGTAATIFTVMTFVQSVSPYVNNLIIYERILKRNINRMLLLTFSLSTISFFMMYAVHNSMINIVFLLLALMSSNGASEMLWSVYCPSLRDTGMVSSATGYLDFMSYVAAGAANLLFANAISQIGWGNLILVWAAFMLVGVIFSLPLKIKSERIQKKEHF